MSCPVAKAVGLEHIGNAPIEALDHAVGLRRPRLGQAVLDAQGLTQLIKLMRSTGLALSAAKQTVSELFSVVCQQLWRILIGHALCSAFRKSSKRCARSYWF